MLNDRKRYKIKKAILKALEKSSAHGIPNIIGANNLIIQTLWILFTFISTGLCIYIITGNVLNYFEYKVTTTTRVIYDFNATFPSVTICNTNFFSSREGSIFYNETLKSKNNSLYSHHNYGYAIQNALLYANDSIKLKSFGKSLEEMVPYFYFDNEDGNYEEDFRHIFTTFFGNCYIFNPHLYKNGTKRSPKRISKISKLSGLGLELKFSSNRSENKIQRGMLLVHEFGSSPFSSAPVYVQQNQTTLINLKRTISTQYPKPYSKCVENTDDPNQYDSELFKAIHDTNFKYNQAQCFDLCFHRLLIENCSCFYYELTFFTEGQPCLKDEGIECNLHVYNNFLKSEYSVNKCLLKCPLECSSLSIVNIVTSADYNNDDSTYVRINFEDYLVTKIEESPALIIGTLFSNIGGTIGLFLGISFLSFIEILSLFIEILLILLSNNFKYQIRQ